jgi:hypothetical protein
MFEFTYQNYKTHAFPLDELRPRSCGGKVRRQGASGVGLQRGAG